MGIYSVVVAIFIILAVTSFDLLRKKETKFDFLRLINIIFVLAYGVAPIYIYYFTDYFTLATIRHNDIMRVEFLWAMLLAVLFYVIMVSSYYFSRKLELLKRVEGFSEKLFKETNNKQFGKVAFILTLIGGACLLYYIRIVGGFSEFLRLGPILRDEGNYIQHPLMFIINIAPILCVASFIYYALFRSGKGLGKLVYGMWFLLSLIGAFLVVFHSSGRMQVFTFLMVFPLAMIVYKNKLRVSTIVFGSILFLVLVLYGNSLLNIEREVTINDSSFVETSANIVREFTFPLTNVANNIIIFPSQYDFRWGVPDVVKAPTELLPSRLVNFDFLKGENASQFNTSHYDTKGTIPVDIISFGYMSFGVAGVMIMAVVFGLFIRLVENLFSYRGNLVASMFYVAMMILVAFRIMYGDPAHLVHSSFRYAVAICLILFIVRPRKSIVWEKRRFPKAV